MIVIDHSLLESLESIGETSLHDVEINRHTNDTHNTAAPIAPTSAAAAATEREPLDRLLETIERSTGRVDIARRTEASEEQAHRCDRVLRIDAESSQCSTLRILPETQFHRSRSDIGRDFGIARVELVRPLKISQRTL